MIAKHARTLDVRPLPTWDRHAHIFAAFADLRDTARLTTVTDHEPRPLRFQFERRYPKEFVWEQRQLGISRWEVTLRRLPSAGDAEDLPAFCRRCSLLSNASEQTVCAFARRASERMFEDGATNRMRSGRTLGSFRLGTLSAIMSSTTGRDQNLFDLLLCDPFSDVETIDGGRTLSRIVVTAGLARVVLIPRGIVISAMPPT